MSNFLAGKNVVLPSDFSEESMAAFDEAVGMVDETTKLFVVHVLIPLSHVALEPAVIVDAPSDESRRASAIEQMKARINDPLNRTSFAARFGDPGSEIVSFANEIKADMIIMPSHGRTGLSRFVLGSVAERVLRLSECPVLVLRHPKKA